MFWYYEYTCTLEVVEEFSAITTRLDNQCYPWGATYQQFIAAHNMDAFSKDNNHVPVDI